MSVLNENTIIGASAASDYEIEQSLRFDDGSTSYLKRTPTAASNRRTWTFSAWVKRGSLPSNVQTIFMASNPSSAGAMLRFNADKLVLLGYNGGVSYSLATNRLFRDPSAWYHIVLAVDTTQGTAANRIKMYVNGVQETSFSTSTYPSQNLETYVNSTNPHYIGVTDESSLKLYFDGYIGEVNFIDGQALTPDSFGETGDYGEWKPTKYAGAYGTNGFYLPFKQDYTVEGFSTVVYEGNGTSQYVGGVGFSPDLVWAKSRSAATSHGIADSVRGVRNILSSNGTAAEYAESAGNTLTAFDTDGFTVGADGNYTAFNANGSDIVAWNWDMGGTTASNTAGSITSSVRANTTYGQSIVTYSANGSSATIGHGLSSVPELIIVKKRNATERWCVFHTSTSNAYLYLNETFAAETGNADDRFGNNTSVVQPTSSVFSVGQSNDVNGSSGTYVAYCFSDVTGYSKFGSYSGNGNSTGPTVTLGFSPAFVMIKRTDSASSGAWNMWDNVRDTTNPNNTILEAQDSAAEVSNGNYNINFTATGFEVLGTYAGINSSGSPYIYMAFADTREYAYWYDQSGNNNDWTSEGGLTESDVMVDSPTNNFCVMNPLALGTDGTLSEGNLKLIYGGSGTRTTTTATMGFASGKWYWEVAVNHNGGEVIGITNISDYTSIYPGQAAGSWGYYADDGNKYVEGTASSYGAGYTAGDIISFALDMDNGTLVAYKNNSSQGTLVSSLTGDIYPAIGDGGAGGTTNNVFNFGQDSSFAGTKTPQGNQDANAIGDFYYAPPTGFLALCTKNLPDATVVPSEHFNTVLYTGDGTANRQITGVGFQPDFVWHKARSTTHHNELHDAVRGAGLRLISNDTYAEADHTAQFNSFDVDGFTVSEGNKEYNEASTTYVNWNWKAGGSASSNTNGTITSQVSANVDAGFSIVSYTGTGSASTIGHGLSASPEMIIVKDRNATYNWFVFHIGDTAAPETDFMNLDQTDATQDLNTIWNDTLPTASVFSVGTHIVVNTNTNDYIAYCFNSVDNYSKVGSYTGNGSTDGTFVYTGFRPAWVMIKRSDAAGDDWHIVDMTRDTYNVATHRLKANSSATESSTDTSMDALSNGFKLRNTSGARNAGGTYIYLAFAETPFKHSNAR